MGTWTSRKATGQFGVADGRARVLWLSFMTALIGCKESFDAPAEEDTAEIGSSSAGDEVSAATASGDGDGDGDGDEAGDGDGDLNSCGFVEGWEEGNAPTTGGWSTGGGGPWGVSPWEEGVHAGMYGARSEELDANDASWLRRSVTIPPGGATLSFWYWASVGPGDGLEVSFDGALEQAFAATDAFELQEVSMPEGQYELEFRAVRDGSGGAGVYNRVWLDEMSIVCP